MFDLGAAGIEEEKNSLISYFGDCTNIDQTLSDIRKRLEFFEKELGLTGPFPLEVVQVQQENWEQNWKQYFKPIEVDSKLIITPSWEKPEANEDQIVITIDPQQAFGTGGHGTTYLMLQALVRHVRSGVKVLDVGTGSGILAIAAARLGASQILAFDNDPIAIETAVRNSVLNEVKGSIHFFVGDRPNLNGNYEGFDLILANILSGNLIPMIPHLVSFLRSSDNHLILSGFLYDEKEKMKSAIQKNGLAIRNEKTSGEWISMVCQQDTEKI